MKRSPLQSRTPLVRRTGLRSVTPLSQGKSGLTRTPMPSTSAKRTVDNRVRAVAVAELREDTCWCAHCGRPTETAGHEVLGRSHGGDFTRPNVLVCGPCNSGFEDQPISAAWDGWKVSGKNPRDPDLPDGYARDVRGVLVFVGEARSRWGGAA